MDNVKKPILCVGHSPCLDGFAAMWVVGTKFGFENVEFVGVKYGDPFPDMTDREVYIVDFSYPPKILIPAAKTAKKIVVLDHHETARQQWETQQLTPIVRNWLTEQCPQLAGDLYFLGHEGVTKPPHTLGWYLETVATMPDNLEVVFGDDKAGAGTAWNYFFPGEDMPIILNAIDHGDRWVFDKVLSTREVCEFCRASGLLRSNPEKFDYFTRLIQNTAAAHDTLNLASYQGIADKGAYLAKAYDSLVEEFVPFDKPNLVRFMGYEVPCHAVPDFFKSSVGDRFGKKYPFSITYDDNLVPGHRKFSLRSDKETGVNVKTIAEYFSGGGHDHAAGFTVPFSIQTLDASVQAMLNAAWVKAGYLALGPLQ